MKCECPSHDCPRKRRKGRRVCSWCAEVCDPIGTPSRVNHTDSAGALKKMLRPWVASDER